ncbi:NAD(P)H-quinone oxidoreductase subunit 4 [Spirulina major]|uniref:NAD(P)H-quinone oxidoreductase subunit 4 n=1 Tax=Spirulina major TaxID=270636 RepID=UPI000932E9C2|nr:NAD(P)H-quinone oxidoreductase subunit 4 [Spirulina major]
MFTTQVPWLTTLILLPMVAAIAVPLIPDKDGKTLRWYGLGVGLVELALTVYLAATQFDRTAVGFQLSETYAWLPQLGVNWSVAVDGISLPLLVLTAFVNTLALMAAWRVSHKPRLFYGLMLALYGAQMGVFVAKDLLLFFTMWELELVPVYLLISIWGGPKRLYAATKFILYTALASLFILVAGLGLAFSGDRITFDLAELGLKEYPAALELFAYVGFLIAFAVKLPMFPVHTWLPDAHGEASAPVSMVLAGILLKMGGYGLIRMNMELLPNAHSHFAPVLVVLGVVNIVYGAFAAFGQTNLKRRLAYSSVSHMGFVLIGLASFTEVGLNGAMLQMLSHGLIAAALFFLAGAAYDRTHTLMMDEMSGLAQQMPKIFALFTVAAMASLALPGMSGFVSELTVFLGMANSDAYSLSFKTVIVFLSAVGLILTPIYLLSMLREVFYGDGAPAPKQDNWFSDANPREVFIAVCFLVPIIGIGLYPKLAMTSYDTKTVHIAQKVGAALPIFATVEPQEMTAEQVLFPITPALIAPQLD